MKKSWNKQTWLLFTLIALGLLFVIISSTGLFKPKNVFLVALTDTGLKTLGFSFISTALVTYLKSKSEDTNIEEISKKLSEVKDKVEQFSVNKRIKKGKHLKDEFPRMLKESVTEDDGIIRIDVKGMELYNFWKDQKDVIMNEMKHFHIRLLVQDPLSKSFEEMVLNEGVNNDQIKNHIIQMTKEIDKIKKEESIFNNKDRIIEVRWLSFPASVTMTRVNNQMYVRTRLMNANNMNDLHFFEKYYKDDLPFETFSTLFEMEWNNYDEEPCEAKKHKKELCGDEN